MLSRIWLINTCLALLVTFFGVKAYGIWFGGDKPGPEMQAVEDHRTLPPKRSFSRVITKRVPPESTYSVVVSKNLFSQQRQELNPGEKDRKGKDGAGSSLKEKELQACLGRITLYGVVITDDHKTALVVYKEKKRTSSKKRRLQSKTGAKTTRWLKEGDTLESFKVAGILEDKLLLMAGGNSYDLLLYDKDKPKSRVAIRRAPSPSGTTKQVTDSRKQRKSTAKGRNATESAAGKKAAVKPTPSDQSSEESKTARPNPLAIFKQFGLGRKAPQ